MNDCPHKVMIVLCTLVIDLVLDQLYNHYDILKRDSDYSSWNIYYHHIYIVLLHLPGLTFKKSQHTREIMTFYFVILYTEIQYTEAYSQTPNNIILFRNFILKNAKMCLLV